MQFAIHTFLQIYLTVEVSGGTQETNSFSHIPCLIPNMVGTSVMITCQRLGRDAQTFELLQGGFPFGMIYQRCS